MFGDCVVFSNFHTKKKKTRKVQFSFGEWSKTGPEERPVMLSISVVMIYICTYGF